MRGIKNPNVDIKTDGNDVVMTNGKTEYFRKTKSDQTVAIANDAIECSSYEEDGLYNEDDIRLAIGRVLINMMNISY